ncbi:MAG TPA: acetyl-CoA carboxylase carboxyltransferase subunit alpha, partial [Oceanipulchritudo sp.]|nr:acetyl-CoA carboxylase carboxyltransferase subunit alpha [Oceanipulchritudo sp.]
MDKAEFTLEFEKPLRALQLRLEELLAASEEQNFDVSAEAEAIRKRLEVSKREIYSNLTPWQRVQLARHPKRPYSLDYIAQIFSGFQELHGDRNYGDDQALIGGTAFFEGLPVMIIAQQKGRDVKENLRRNFGMPHPEGYRKALRLMEMAQRFGMPVITFIDTKAAYAGVGSEERHVSEAIARNLREMASLKVPLVGIIIGEGGSGGALGIAVVDRLLVQQHAYYSVIPPEGCAAILWRDRKFSETAANALKLGARELLDQGVADSVVEEP